jgi:hypothetical protein
MGPWDCDIERNLRIHWVLLCGLAEDRVKWGDGVRTTDVLIACRLWMSGLEERLYTFQVDAATCSLYKHFLSIIRSLPSMLLDSSFVANFTILSVKLNPGFPWQKQHSAKRKLFTSKLDLNLRKTLVHCYIWRLSFCGAEIWKLRKVDQKCLEVLKCGAGEGWRRSVGPIVWEMKKYYIESRRTGMSYKQ